MSAHRQLVKLEIFYHRLVYSVNINRCSINQWFLPHRVYKTIVIWNPIKIQLNERTSIKKTKQIFIVDTLYKQILQVYVQPKQQYI